MFSWTLKPTRTWCCPNRFRGRDLPLSSFDLRVDALEVKVVALLNSKYTFREDEGASGEILAVRNLDACPAAKGANEIDQGRRGHRRDASRR